MKLFMSNIVVADDIIVPVNIEVNTPNFRTAFADSSSNAKSKPLIKFSFATFLLIVICSDSSFSFSFECPLDELKLKRMDLILVFKSDNMLKDTDMPITIITNTSIIDVIKEMYILGIKYRC